jgi:hypothetical protein
MSRTLTVMRLLLPLFFGCGAPPGAQDVPATHDSGGDPTTETGQGCVSNRRTAVSYPDLQTAMDASRSGDVLDLCADEVVAGGTASWPLTISAGEVSGTLSLPGGAVAGTQVAHLVASEGATSLFAAFVGQLDLAGSLTADGGEITALAVAEGGVADLSGTSVVEADSAGTLRVEGGSVGVLRTSGAVVLLDLTLGGLEVDGGLTSGSDLALTGAVRIGSGTLALERLTVTDAGAVALQVEGGVAVVNGADLVDTAVDVGNVGLHQTGGSLSLSDAVISGFSGDAILQEGGTLTLSAVDAGGQVSATAPALLDAAGLVCTHLELAGVDASLWSFEATSLSAAGGQLTLEQSSIGGAVGVLVDLDDVDAQLSDVALGPVTGEIERIDLPDGGWTEQDLGGTAINVVAGSLRVDGVAIQNADWGLVMEGGSLQGDGLDLSWTWRAGLVVQDATVDLSDLSVLDARGWGVSASRSSVRLDGLWISELDRERRVVQVYDAHGTLTSEVITSVSDPGVGVVDGSLELTWPTLVGLAGAAVDFSSADDGAIFLVEDGVINDVGGGGIAATFGGAGRATLTRVQIQAVGGAGLVVSGGAGAEATISTLKVDTSDNQAVYLEGLGVVRLDGVVVARSLGHGVDLVSVAAVDAQDLSIESAGGDGLRLEASEGDVREVSVSGAAEAGVRLVGSSPSLVDGTVDAAVLGLSCDAASWPTACSGWVLTDVGTALDGCPSTCVE